MNEKEILEFFEFEQIYMKGRELYCSYLGENYYACVMFNNGIIESMGISKDLFLLTNGKGYFKTTYNNNSKMDIGDFKNELFWLIRDCGILIGTEQRNKEIKNLLDIK